MKDTSVPFSVFSCSCRSLRRTYCCTTCHMYVCMYHAVAPSSLAYLLLRSSTKTRGKRRGRRDNKHHHEKQDSSIARPSVRIIRMVYGVLRYCCTEYTAPTTGLTKMRNDPLLVYFLLQYLCSCCGYTREGFLCTVVPGTLLYDAQRVLTQPLAPFCAHDLCIVRYVPGGACEAFTACVYLPVLFCVCCV